MTLESRSDLHSALPPETARRRLVLGSMALAGLGVLGASGALRSRAADAAALPDATGLAGFIHLSSYLTGHATLDGVMARTLHTALQQDAADFALQLAHLNEFLAATPTPAASLQAVLDASHPELASLPRRVMSAWYLGVVGTGANARAVAYEEALMYPPVADVVVMPSYARGVPGYWAQALQPGHS
jgi:hypothetical protein